MDFPEPRGTCQQLAFGLELQHWLFLGSPAYGSTPLGVFCFFGGFFTCQASGHMSPLLTMKTSVSFLWRTLTDTSPNLSDGEEADTHPTPMGMGPAPWRTSVWTPEPPGESDGSWRRIQGGSDKWKTTSFCTSFKQDWTKPELVWFGWLESPMCRKVTGSG